MTVRSLGQSDDGKLDQTSETLAPFWLVQADDPFALPGFQGPPVTMLSTYQGWIQKIQMWLQRNHIPFMTYDMRQPRMPAPDLGGMFGFRFNQKEVVTKFLLADQSGLLGAPTRWGKCFGRGTPVLMADWSIKPVEEVRSGDNVMGPDSKPRRVAGTVRGYSNLYKVTPNYNGMPWVCNEDHLLHVQRVREDSRIVGLAGTTENISVKDWLKSTTWFKHVRKQRRVSLDYPQVQQPVDPYIYGVWLGDGHSDGIRFTNMEPEVWQAIEVWAKTVNLVESGHTVSAGKAQTRGWVKSLYGKNSVRGCNTVRQFFTARPKSAGIRPEYIKASKQQRLQLLAGLLDTDGASGGSTNCSIISKHKKLAEDIAFLCQSLGFGATVRPTWKQAQTGPKRCYWKVCIRGPVDQIPFKVPRKNRVRKNKFNCLTVGFEVKPIGPGEYFGFALEDPEGLFLLGDCTVVHNTTAIVNTLRAYPGVKTVLTAPGTDLLLNNLLPDIRKAMPHLDIKVLCTGSKDRTQSEQLTICSVDSLYKCDPDTTRLVLIDEPHALPTDKRLGYFLNFKYARKLGFGATLEGRFDKRDPLIEGVIGPVLSKTTYKECRDIGAVAHLEVFMLKYSYDRFNCRDRLGAYKHLLFHNERITQILDIILNPGASFFPAQWQILGFIHNEKQANFLRENLKVPFDLAMAKLMTDKQRAEQMDRLKTGLARLTFATNIYAQGVTFSDLMVVLNLAGGGASTQTIQKPGRVLEVRPGKRCGIVIDFMFGARDRFVDVRRDRSDCWQPARESLARKEYYQKVGFNVTEVGSLAELKELLRKRCWPISTCTT